MRNRSLKLLTNILLVMAIILPLPASAVSLGDELVMSRLGDPVEIEIEVLQWQDLDMDRVQIGVGTPAEYDAFGLQRLPVLDTLSFNLIGPDGAGRVTLLVSNREPVLEPFLELLMVMRWPGGSLLREYVLLFDPPGLEQPQEQVTELSMTSEITEPVSAAVANRPATVVETPIDPEAVVIEPTLPPATTEPEVPSIRNQLAIDVAPVAPVVPPRVPSAEAGQTGRQRYQVQSGDSLWDIAGSYQQGNPESDLYLSLVSLHDLNRDAFINGNISLLKSGSMLQIPTARDMSLINRAAARQIFEQRWEEGTERFTLARQGEALPLFSEVYANNLLESEVSPIAAEPALPAGIESTDLREEPGLLMPASDTPLIATATVIDSPQLTQVEIEAVTEEAATDEMSAAPVTAGNEQFASGQISSVTAADSPQTQNPALDVVTETAMQSEVESPQTSTGQESVTGISEVSGTTAPVSGNGLPINLAQYSDNPYLSGISENARSIKLLLSVRQERLDNIAENAIARDYEMEQARAATASIQAQLVLLQRKSGTGLLSPQTEKNLALAMLMLTLLGTGLIIRETTLIRARY